MAIDRRNYGRTPNDHDYCEWLDEPRDYGPLDRLKSAGHRYWGELAHRAMILSPSERRWRRRAPQLAQELRELAGKMHRVSLKERTLAIAAEYERVAERSHRTEKTR
jgi:hypothetical protein